MLVYQHIVLTFVPIKLAFLRFEYKARRTIHGYTILDYC